MQHYLKDIKLYENPLHFIISTKPNHMTVLEMLLAAVRGGVRILQIRDKTASDVEILQLASQIRKTLNQTMPETPIYILLNDRVDLAMQLGKEIISGVHIGQSDMEAKQARNKLWSDAIIGLTIKNQQDLQAAPHARLDYLSFGGVFGTKSKLNPDPPIAIAGLQALVRAAQEIYPDMPYCAIAGIDAHNIASVSMQHIDMIAIIAGLRDCPNPQALSQKAQLLTQKYQEGRA